MPEYRPKKKKKSRAGSVALSLLVFVLFLAIFGGVFLWAIIDNRLPTDGASSTASEEAGPHFTGEDVRWLFIAAQDGSEPRGFVAVRADPQNGRIHAVAVPKETEVADGTTLIRLDELFRKNGVAAAQAAVGNLLGVSFPHYVSMTYANIEKLLQYFDSSLQFTLTEDLDCREGDYFIKMNSGRYTLTPKQAVDILRYPSWQHKGLQQQADIHAEMLAALVNQYMTAGRESQLEADFSKVAELAKTDIRISHFTAYRESLQALAKANGGAVCTPVSLEGRYVGGGEDKRFAADGAAEQMTRLFGETH